MNESLPVRERIDFLKGDSVNAWRHAAEAAGHCRNTSPGLVDITDDRGQRKKLPARVIEQVLGVGDVVGEHCISLARVRRPGMRRTMTAGVVHAHHQASAGWSSFALIRPRIARQPRIARIWLEFQLGLDRMTDTFGRQPIAVLDQPFFVRNFKFVAIRPGRGARTPLRWRTWSRRRGSRWRTPRRRALGKRWAQISAWRANDSSHFLRGAGGASSRAGCGAVGCAPC